MSTIERYSPRGGDAVLPLFCFKGRTAIVSGTAAGIGLALAEALAEAGAKVRAEAIGKKRGVETAAYQVDVVFQKAVQEAVDTIASEFKNCLDIFIANSGIPWTKGAVPAAAKEGFDHYRKIIATDVDTRLHFRRQGTGSFIVPACMSGHITIIPELQTTVIYYVKGLAVQWAGLARANSVSPDYIATQISDFVPKETKDICKEKIPLHREGLANELKGAYLYLASDAATYTTGTDIIVDRAWVLP
ncbi:hypothetical protein B9Z19DRAFT_1154686 [Tuber borchii]|uniref:Short chain dehydrogenase n=1 Tax=Tuber borchii TaxID=42251 RepID=A0A2T6ZI99_TUBBO|nr:hypothetical protein B9Z19DRAFT_1154686 [Tuber borchii]